MKHAHIDSLSFKVLDDRSEGLTAVRRELKLSVGDDRGRVLVVLGNLLASQGRIKEATQKANDASALLVSEIGKVELLGLRVSILRDRGDSAQALALARAVVRAEYSDVEALRHAHYKLGMLEGASGNLSRAKACWFIAAQTERPLYRFASLINHAKDLAAEGKVSEGKQLVQQTAGLEAPNAWVVGCDHVRGALAAAEGDFAEAANWERQAIAGLEGTEPLRLARHTLVLLGYLIQGGRLCAAQQLLSGARSLVFELEDERKELAAGVLLGLMRASAASKLSQELIVRSQAELAELSRPGPGIQGRA